MLRAGLWVLGAPSSGCREVGDTRVAGGLCPSPGALRIPAGEPNCLGGVRVRVRVTV